MAVAAPKVQICIMLHQSARPVDVVVDAAVVVVVVGVGVIGGRVEMRSLQTLTGRNGNGEPIFGPYSHSRSDRISGSQMKTSAINPTRQLHPAASRRRAQFVGRMLISCQSLRSAAQSERSDEEARGLPEASSPLTCSP